ncbi:hypothetical protein A3K86_12685 [Photobacterium jeanii]|uniref:Uncharacterized protein n=1 Tax=Photobacterium jeanii TaxID=858640 RepID=A0A178KB21_9GAMM|nr:hypothetical protein [Photobacterium jeanii]OAN13882.1 hypothetical protein A3K86_12685 [Photobacterium jeanii]PST89867.1 hypothetical protein C9I91_12890 [Photobacterium jeanii]
MLTLISNNSLSPQAITQTVHAHVEEFAPILALATLNTLHGETCFSSLEKTCTEHLHEWWGLAIPADQPDNQYEATYWYLLHLLEAIEEHQLLGNMFVQHKVTLCANFLLGIGPAPDNVQGTRP